MRSRRLLFNATLALGLSLAALLIPAAPAAAGGWCEDTIQLECGDSFQCPEDESSLPCSARAPYPCRTAAYRKGARPRSGISATTASSKPAATQPVDRGRLGSLYSLTTCILDSKLLQRH